MSGVEVKDLACNALEELGDGVTARDINRATHGLTDASNASQSCRSLSRRGVVIINSLGDQRFSVSAFESIIFAAIDSIASSCCSSSRAIAEAMKASR